MFSIGKISFKTSFLVFMIEEIKMNILPYKIKNGLKSKYT